MSNTNRTVVQFAERLAALPRDKADTLLLILTCTCVLLPFISSSPVELSIAACLLIVWRVTVTLRGVPLPGNWQLTLVSALLVAGVYLHFHTLFGKDAGIAFLIILVCLKMMELHARRDAVAVLFSCYFLLVGQLIYSQSLPSALYLVFCAGLIISAQFTFQYHQLLPSLSKRLFSGFRVVGIALPIALMLFLFFPRIQGPLWGKPQGNQVGITGLSDSMEPGNVAELALSDQIAFRAKIDGFTPRPSQLYWRGIVLTTFNGTRWSVNAPTRDIRTVSPTAGTPVNQKIILEPHNQRWLFALDRPVGLSDYNGSVVSSDNPAGRLTAYDEMRSQEPVQDRIHYTVTSDLTHTGAPTARSAADKLELQITSLQLPEGYNPLTIQWAQQLRQKSGSPLDAVARVLQFFHQQPFKYTLTPAPFGANQVDDFLFGTQAGFCEHYASAFVIIMRAAGIPARVVTGYQGGEMNPYDGYLTIRQSDAHAWAEIWTDQDGWLRVDPTAAVAPERVERGINSSFPNRNLTGLINFDRQSWMADVARKLRSRWDATNSAWNLWVLNYSLDKQKSLFSSLTGIEHPQAAQLGVAMMIAASLLVAAISYLLMGRPAAMSDIDKLYLTFCEHMQGLGFPRMAHEGALDYARRLEPHFYNKSGIVDFLTLYNRCKYGRTYHSTQLLLLKKCLKPCLQIKSVPASTPSAN